MEGLLHYTSNWWWMLAAIGLVWLTDIIDWVVDKWLK
jgi:CDP-diglyceride synthetase